MKHLVMLTLLLSLLLLVLGCGEQKTVEENPPAQEEVITTQPDTVAPTAADCTATPAPEPEK